MINKKPKELLCDLFDYLETKNELTEEIKQFFKNYTDTDLYKEALDSWYITENTDKPAYFLYDEWLFLLCAFTCFRDYSRKYILGLDKCADIHNIFSECETLLDMGNGLGLSTLAFKELWPHLDCKGTNMVPSKQYDHNRHLGIEIVEPIGNFDIIIAFEYMEHIKEPIKELNKILDLNPKVLILANSFNTRAIGHFTNYLIDDEIIPQDKISRIFNKYLRSKGWHQLKLGLWNNKPAVWQKNNNI